MNGYEWFESMMEEKLGRKLVREDIITLLAVAHACEMNSPSPHDAPYDYAEGYNSCYELMKDVASKWNL